MVRIDQGLLSSAPSKPKFSVQNSVTGTKPGFLNPLKPCAPRGSVMCIVTDNRGATQIFWSDNTAGIQAAAYRKPCAPSRTVNRLRSTNSDKLSSCSILNAWLQTPTPARTRCRGYNCLASCANQPTCVNLETTNQDHWMLIQWMGWGGLSAEKKDGKWRAWAQKNPTSYHIHWISI